MNVINKFLIPALALGMFAACSDDNKFEGPADDTTQDTRVQYLNISIASGNSLSRAGELGTDADYDDGDIEESGLKNIYFVFYDASGNLVTTIGPKSTSEFTVGNNEPYNVEKVLSGTIAIELEKGASDPAYVMCYINPIQTGSTATGEGSKDNASLKAPTIGDIKNIKRTEVFKTEEGKKYFGMSNSVYYDKDNNLVRATPIPAGALKLKKEDLKNAPEVKIYVERYAAKVKVTYASATNNVVNLHEQKYNLTFIVEDWYLNAREKEYFVSKSFTKTVSGDGVGSMGAENATKSDLNNQLSHWTTWNAPELNRSFWARSVNYFSSDYPNVSDDINEDGSNYNVDYFSYNQITSGSDKVGLTSGAAIYARENTIGGNALGGVTNTLAALSSVVLVGKYSLEGYDPNTTFYVRDNKVYFSEANADNGDLSIYQGLLGNGVNGILQVETAAATETTKATYKSIDGSESDILSLLEVYHPFGKTESAVSVRVKENVTDAQLQSAKLYYVSSGVRKALRNADIKAMNNLLLANVGTMDAYTNGMAYFSIPIRHLGWQREGNINKTAETINWSAVKEGDFGIVRNHSYDIEITSFGNGLGSGIFDPNKPIVPEKTKTTWYGNYKLRILSWRIVPKQSVAL